MPVVDVIRNKEDLEKIENYLLRHNKRNHLIWVLALNTGLKISELLSLNVGNAKAINAIMITNPKTGMVKRVELNKKAMSYLYKYLSRKPLRLKEPLFQTRNGNRFDRTQVYRFIKEACKVTGVKTRISGLSLKKTFLYHSFLESNNDIVLLQKLTNKNTPIKALDFIGVTYNDVTYACPTFQL